MTYVIDYFLMLSSATVSLLKLSPFESLFPQILLKLSPFESLFPQI